MTPTRERRREPIPGYLLIEPLGRGGFGEVWKCEAPGGLHKAIKFVEGDGSHALVEDAPARKELKAIERVKSLRHPFLLSMERVEVIDDELVIVMELADRSLREVFEEYRAAGATGIPRGELLNYLSEAADVLDLMNVRHGLQHLDIKPANLFLVSNHVKVGDFGLVRGLSERGTAADNTLLSGGMTALYAAPEMFREIITSSCDQYSLAIVFQELLTGQLPFDGKNARQLLMQHSTAKPDLRPLPPGDRAAVARALAKNPKQRFPTCKAFVQALRTKAKNSPGANAIRSAPTRRAAAKVGESPTPFAGRADCGVAVAELIIEAKGEPPASEAENGMPPTPGGGSLHDRFVARPIANNPQDSFETFCRQWNAQFVHAIGNALTMHIPFPGGFWQRWLGGTRGLLLDARWTRPRGNGAARPMMSVIVRGSEKSTPSENALLLHKVGPLLLESLRSQLEAYPERRTRERVAWPHPVRVIFLHEDEPPSEAIEGKGKDLSLSGMGLILPRAQAGCRLRLELLSPSRDEPIVLSGQCVRVQRCKDGWFETGILF